MSWRRSATQRRWVASVFSIAPVGSVGRRPTDIVRAVAALVAVLVVSVGARWLTDVEKWTYDVLSSVPGDLDWVARLIDPVALVVVLGVIVGGAVVSRRASLAVAMAIAVGVAAAGAVVLDNHFGADQLGALRDAGADLSASDLAYPPLVLTVLVAALLAALPHLTRPAARSVRLLVVLAACCSVVVLDALPAGAIVALTLAWGAAAVAHLALGTPAATPSPSEIADGLRAFGLEATSAQVRVDPIQEWGQSTYHATVDGRDLAVTAIGRDASDARLFARLWRLLWYKDPGPSLGLTRAGQVEHQAFVLLLAERAGARVPALAAVGVAGEAACAFLVVDEVSGRPLRELDAEELTDDVLDAAWEAVGRLRSASLVDGELTADELVLGDDGVVGLAGCSRMAVVGSAEELRLDAVDALVTTAGLVGAPRAFAAARRALGPDELGRLVPLLQPSVLRRPIKRGVSDLKGLLGELRGLATDQLGVEAAQPVELRRVSPANLAMAVGAAFGVYLLVGELAGIPDPKEVFANPEWGFVILAFVLSQTPQFAQAIAMLGSVAVKLPLGPVTAVQFANNFTGLVGGTVATTALVVRFFQKQGQVVAVAISSGVLNSLAALITQTILTTVGLLLTASQFELPSSSGGGSSWQWVVWVIAGIGGIAGVLLLTPRLRKRLAAKIAPQFRAARQNLSELVHNPRKAVELFGGNVASQILFALTLDASLHAYGASLPLMQLVVINSFASLLGGVAPVPGGMGVIEAGLIGGLTAAGVPQETAVAATFTHRLFTAYLPPIWGWFSLNWLREKDYV